MTKPDHMPWLSPYLMCIDVDKALDFYQKAFKFETTSEIIPGEDGTTCHAAMRFRDQIIMLGKTGIYSNVPSPSADGGTKCPISLYIYVDDVDNFFKNAKANGAAVIDEPSDAFWGDRICQLKDPDGYIWSFATYLNA